MANEWILRGKDRIANVFCCFQQGPFVGEKTPSDAITQEYAKADPVYVEKTIVCLPCPSPSLILDAVK